MTPTVNHSGASFEIKLNGAVDSDGVIPLNVGSNVITVEVTAENDTSTRTYTVTVTRTLSANATLRSLSLSGVDFGTFSWLTTTYTATVANSVSRTAVTASTTHSGASYVVKLGGATDSDGVIPLSVGSNVITVEVTAENGSTRRTYTVTVTRLVVTGELSTDSPRVNFRVTGYATTSAGVAWEVPRNRGITRYSLQRYKHNGISYVAEGGTAYEAGATNGGAGHSAADIALEPDTRYKYVLELINDLDMTVIEKSATVRTLSTSSTSASSTDATLSALTLSGVGAFGPFSFRPSSFNYAATTTNSVTQTTVTPTVNHSKASYVIKLNGTVDSDGVIPLSVGGNVISVEVTAEDGVVTRVYTVTVTRAGPGGIMSTDATLSGLTLSGINFGTFRSATTVYSANVSSVTETTVTPTVNHSGATYVIKLDGSIDSDGVIPLGLGSNVITVEVTAEDGNTTKTYTVTVTRTLSANATLRSLSLSGVDFGAFSSLTTTYTATVANSVSQTIVTASTTHAGANYVVKLTGAADSDGVGPTVGWQKCHYH